MISDSACGAVAIKLYHSCCFRRQRISYQIL